MMMTMIVWESRETDSQERASYESWEEQKTTGSTPRADLMAPVISVREYLHRMRYIYIYIYMYNVRER